MGYDGSLKFDTKIDESGFNAGVSKISSAAKKGLAITAGAVVGVGAALGAMTKQSLDSVSKLEQNVGGVETLFKKSSKTVIANANKAYKTAGMSANEYMQNVTSFSASLLQSCAKNTDKAAKVADMAMIDMSDNANKMGTNMVDIQNAYQGFAKQNYTMLDNLKLGYGGTKTEMERLLADASKISGVKYDINNLADVYNAIHVIQKELGITGTTSKEAATTIEGSMNSAKAAYDNFLNGSGSAEELADSIAVMMENIGKNLGEIIPRLASTIPELFSTLWDDMKSEMQQGVQVGAEMITSILLGITEGIPDFLSVGGQVIMSLAGSISSASPQLITAAGTAILALGSGIMQALPQMISYGVQIITQIGNAISQAAPELIPKAIEALAQFALGLISALPQLITVGIQMITSLAQGLINSIPLLIEYVPQIINAFCAAIDTGLLQLIAAGVKIIANLVIGIVQAIPQLIAALPQIVLAIINVFTHINLFSAGKAMIANLKNGIVSAKGNAVKAFSDLTQSLWKKITTTNWLSAGGNIVSKIASGISMFVSKAALNAQILARVIMQNITKINWLDVGAKVVRKIASGLLSLAGKMGSTAKSLGMRAVTAFRGISWGSVGSNIVKGIIGGIGAMAGSLVSKMQGLASSALSAAKKALGIKSPSRVFKKEVGKHIVTGIIAGIDTEQKNLKKTMESLCNTAVSSAKNASKKGNFEDIGKTFTDGLSSAIDTQVSKATTAGKNLINKEIKSGKNKDTDQYDKKIKDLNKKIKKAKKEKKSTKSLEKQLKQVKDKKKAVADTYSQLGKSMITAYSNAVKQQGQQIISQAEKEIEELSASYQEKYNSLIQQRSDMISKLRSTGSLYDLDGDLEAIKNYQNRIRALKGKIPDTLMQQILGMDVASANDYMEYLQSLDPDKYQDYINKWNEIYNGSESFGNDFFQSDLNDLENTYETELTGRLNDLSKKINQIGQNTMKGFISGMQSQTKGMTKAVNSMCNSLIKSMKKKLKIKSPSRVVRDQVGKYLPLGLSAAFGKYMPQATVQMEKEIDTSLAAMRKKVESVEYPSPDTPNYNGPGGYKPVVIVQDNKPVEVNAEIHTTVDLDGKTVGKQITPYVDKNLGNAQTRAERRN
jgi:phage-related protein|nr:MAG TPA: tail tape measure protein [Caudoviricetes sp.]